MKKCEDPFYPSAMTGHLTTANTHKPGNHQNIIQSIKTGMILRPKKNLALFAIDGQTTFS